MVRITTGYSARVPVQSLLMGSQVEDDRSRPGSRELDWVPPGVEQASGVGGRVEVVVEQAVHGGAPVGIGRVRELGGVGPQEVVHGVPAGRVVRDQVGGGQLSQQGPRLGLRDSGEAGRGRRGYVRPGV
jgi:hypothetical protein